MRKDNVRGFLKICGWDPQERSFCVLVEFMRDTGVIEFELECVGIVLCQTRSRDPILMIRFR